MENRVTVSVIVPVYNTKPYLAKCLDSLLNQTLDGIEIIAVDDGSTDGSGQMLDEYGAAHSNIRVFHKPNGGQATARNLALKQITGEYVGFLDSDDYVTPDMFRKLYTKATEENLDYVGTGYSNYMLDEAGNEVPLAGYTGQKVCRDPREMFRHGLVSPFINFYRRSVLEAARAYFPEGVIYEDTAFYAQIIPYIHTIGFIEEPLAVRLRHSNSTMTSVSAQRVSQIFTVLDSLLDYYSTRGLMEGYKNEVEYFCVRILLCSSMDRISTVDGFADRQHLIRQTLEMLKKRFPHYRENPCFTSAKRDLYMKYASLPVLTAMCELMHCKPRPKYL